MADEKKSVGLKIIKIVLLTAYTLIAVTFVFYSIVNMIAAQNNEPFSIFDYKIFSVKNNDMDKISKGDAVIVRKDSEDDADFNSIIVYNDNGIYRVSRIIEIYEDTGEYVIKEDQDSVGKKIFLSDIEGTVNNIKIVFLGYIMDFFDTNWAIIFIIILPASLFSLVLLIKIKKKNQNEPEKEIDDEFNPVFDYEDSGQNNNFIHDIYDENDDNEEDIINIERTFEIDDDVLSKIKERNDALSNYRKMMEQSENGSDEKSIYDQPVDNSEIFQLNENQNSGQYINLFDTQPIVLDKTDNNTNTDNSYTLSSLEQHGIKTNITDDGIEMVMENITSESVMLKINHDGSGVSIATDLFEADIKIAPKTTPELPEN